MKKKLLIIILLFTFLFIPHCCMASVKTYQRTSDNYLVPKDVIVNSNNVVNVLKTPAVASSEKIYDFADLFSEEEKKEIYKKIEQYIKKSNMDSIIVTTKELNGLSLSDYTYNFYDYNDFKDNGVIFVIYIKDTEPEIFMGTGGTASVYYTDSIIKQTLMHVYKNIASKNYYQSLLDYCKIVDGVYSLTQERQGTYKVNDSGDVSLVTPWFEIIVLAGSLTFIIVFALYKVVKKKNENEISDMLETRLDNSTLIVKMEYDRLKESSN